MVAEPDIVRVDRSYRLVLPVSLLKQVAWITGDELDAWLVMGSSKRCRLLSVTEFEADPTIRAVRERIEESSAAPVSPLEFPDLEVDALTYRLIQVRIAPPGPGRRLSIPKTMAVIMNIIPGETDIALRLLHGYIELWTVDALRSAADAPFSRLI